MSTQEPSVALRLLELGVPNGYAYDIANGKRKGSLALALRIFRESGLKVGRLTGLNDNEIAVLEKMQGGEAKAA